MKILQDYEYGQHIPIKCLSCGATGTTKNIDFIGARTLFIDCPTSCNGRIIAIPSPYADLAEIIYLEKDLFWTEFNNYKNSIGKGLLEAHQIVKRLKLKYTFEVTKGLWHLFKRQAHHKALQHFNLI